MDKIKVNKTPPINAIMFICYLLMSVYAYTHTNRVLNSVFITVTIMQIVDGLYFYFFYKRLSIHFYLDEVVEKNEQFIFELKLINQSFLPLPYIEIVPEEGERCELLETGDVVFLLLGKEQVVHPFVYEAKLSGLEEIGINKVVLKSFFFFFRVEIEVYEKVSVKVLPEVRSIANMQGFDDFLARRIVSEGGYAFHKTLVIEDNEIGYELDSYVEGDSQRLIHWKLAAYKDELLVRQREKNGQKQKNIFLILNPFLDNEEENMIRRQDKLITTFVSLAGYYLEKNREIDVAYYKDDTWNVVQVRNKIQLRGLQENLGDYRCLLPGDIKQQIHTVKKFIKLVSKRNGMKIIVTGHWTVGVEEYILSKGQLEQYSYIWTEENFTRITPLSVWQITGKYEMQLLKKAQK